MSEQSRIELEARRRDVEDFAWLRAENDSQLVAGVLIQLVDEVVKP